MAEDALFGFDPWGWHLANVLLLLAVAALAAVFRKRLAALHLLAITAIILPILPALYVPTFSRTPFADRYLYLSTIGVALLAAIMAHGALTHRGRRCGGRCACHRSGGELLMGRRKERYMEGIVGSRRKRLG